MGNLFTTLLLALVLSLAMPNDTLRLTPTQRASARYHYNVVAWEITRFPSKWLGLLGKMAFPYQKPQESPLEQVKEYLRLRQEAARLQGELELAAASGMASQSNLENNLSDLGRRLDRMRPHVEETLESAVSTVLRHQGVPSSLGPLFFPPVDFALDRLPTVLVVSPRDRIELKESIILNPDVPLNDRDALERRIAESQGLSALVDNLGGISTYPAIVNAYDLHATLAIASHEWLHNYLFFRPLGQAYHRDSQMATLNETAADIFGKEMANLVFTYLTGQPPPSPGPSEEQQCPPGQFCYNPEMRQTRLQVDRLLAGGKIEEAEQYMEQRRQAFVQNGYPLRKLNQAYFAFHGAYADSPASVSPIHQQLLDLRKASPSLAAFIRAVGGVSSYNEFLALVDRGKQSP